jgi:sugar lactone lactonase YvrE
MRKLPSRLLVLFFVSFAAFAVQAQSTYERYRFTTFAGNSPSRGSTDGVGAAARFSYPQGVAVDAAGNIYVADSNNCTVRKVTPSGVVTTLAGSAGSFPGSADGHGSSARFRYPTGLALDSAGNIYVADSGNSTIRKVTPSGDVSTFAGTAEQRGSADGTGSSARFNGPIDVAVDATGIVYVADQSNQTIRKISPTGVTTTVAGSPLSEGFSDGAGSAARFSFPAALTVDSGGNIFVADTNNHTIRKITPAGVVSTFAGAAGGPGSADGVGSNARFNLPQGICVDSQGNVFVGDNGTIRRITPAAVVTTVAGSSGNYGSADGHGSAARFVSVLGLAADSSGNIYVADSDPNNEIRKVTPPGQVTTLAGLADTPGSADGSGTAVRFFQPSAVARDAFGNSYVADAENSTIRKIAPDGNVTTFAGSPQMVGSSDGTGSAVRFNRLEGIAVDTNGNVFVSDGGRNNTGFGSGQTIRRISPSGVVTTFAGAAGLPGYTDAVGTAARFNFPGRIGIDGANNIYVADTGNNVIRKITPAGVVTTLAGDGAPGFADGTGSLAHFFAPGAVVAANDGTVYVADTGNQTIRKITPAGVVTTLAGSPHSAGSSDGSGSAARFNLGSSNGCYSNCGSLGASRITGGIGVDSAGNVYVGDTVNHTIRKITPAGVVTTLAGWSQVPGAADGTGSAARFYHPNGLFVDGDGKIYVADTFNSTIRVGGPNAVAQSLNISTRARVEPNDNVLIGGFIVTGSFSKKVAVRALGPSLAQASVSGSLPDPTLELVDAGGAQLGINDDWRAGSNATELQAAGLAPSNDLDSAFIVTLFPNQNYTLIVRGKGAGAGVALVEVYDLNPTADSLLANLSTRALVQTGANVMIGGFIIGGASGADQVVIRALGPSLTQSGIGNALSDPVLELRDGNGALFSANDNWRDGDQAALEASGLAPINDLESAMLKNLLPGNYTAIFYGAGGATGVGLVEVYNLQ